MAGDATPPAAGDDSAAAVIEATATSAVTSEAPTFESHTGDVAARAAADQANTTTTTVLAVPTPTSEGVASASALGQVGTSIEIETELQCTLCHELLCKPISIPCGHSFCRVCLLDFLLSREINDAQCPICRGTVLHVAFASGQEVAPVFNVNVTLWNLIQLLTPHQNRTTGTGSEDEEYSLKFDQFDAKWRIAALQESAHVERRPTALPTLGAPRNPSDFDSSSEDGDENDADDGALERRRIRYPQVHVDNVTQDGLQLSRNVVLDRDDANVDGYHAMRVGLAIMEFPSVFQLYNEHQECAIAVVKFDEDEDLDGGMPLFLSEDGLDDDFIISDHYDDITLQVFDDGGNIVLERQRAARQGTVTFPQLRLDVPGGVYRFRFTDAIYGVFLEIETRLREPHEEFDTLLENGRVGSMIADQAGERGRTERGRRRMSDDDDGFHGSESDDSFIVDDDEEIEMPGEFSGSDEDEEAALERIERRRRVRELADDDDEALDGRYQDTDTSSNDGSGSDGDAEGNEWGQGSHNASDSGSDRDGDEDDAIAVGAAASRSRIIDDDHSDDDDHDAAAAAASSQSIGTMQSETLRQSKKRSRMIVESDDDDGDGGDDEESKENEDDRDDHVPADPPASSATREILDQADVREGYPSKRLRHVASRIFIDDDEEDVKEESDGEGEDYASSRSRWVGSDPFEVRDVRGEGDDDVEDDGEAEDAYALRASPMRRRHLLDDEMDDEFDEEEHEDPWNTSEHGDEEEAMDSDI